MTIKKLLGIACLLLLSLPTFAQFEGTKTGDRIGKGQDSIENAYFVQDYLYYVDEQNWTKSYQAWKELMTSAPFWSSKLYKEGIDILFRCFQGAETQEDKQKYFDEMQTLLDLRLQRLDSINSFDKVPATRGDIMVKRAYYYDMEIQDLENKPDATELTGILYNKYKEAVKEVSETGGHEVTSSILMRYYDLSELYYNTAPDYYREQFITDYLDLRQACESMIDNAKDVKDSLEQVQIANDWDVVLQNMDYKFTNSGAADPEILIEDFGPKVEKNKDDVEYLNTIIKLLSSNGCGDSEVYYNACNYAYDIMPTYDAAVGCAASQVALGNINEATKYYNTAIELSPDETTKGKMCLFIANQLTEHECYDKAKEYLDQVKKYDQSLLPKVYYQQAEIYKKKQQWDNATMFYKEAEKADVTLIPAADRQIAIVKQYKENAAIYEAAMEKAKAQRAKQLAAAQAAAKAKAANKNSGVLSAAQQAKKAEYERKMAEYKKKKAAYDKQKAAYEAKKKADADFWNE